MYFSICRPFILSAFIGAHVTTTSSYSNLVIGNSFSLSCYSDFGVSSIELFYGNRSVLRSFQNRQITFWHSLVSTDDEGVLYRCLVTSQPDSAIQEKNITLSVGGKWYYPKMEINKCAQNSCQVVQECIAATKEHPACMSAMKMLGRILFRSYTTVLLLLSLH